jgi:nitroreductase
MEFYDLVKERRSVRVFTAQPIGEERVQRILEAANAAPSAGDLQAYEIVVVRDRAALARLAKAAYGQGFIAQAQLALVFCTNAGRSSIKYGTRGERLYAIQDATIAATFAMLAITAEGVATTWVGAFDDERVAEVIGNPPGLAPVAIIPIGYAGEDPPPTPRRPLSDIVHEL